MKIGNRTIGPVQFMLLLAFLASLALGISQGTARAEVRALLLNCNENKTVSYKAATATTAEERFVAVEEWNTAENRRFSYHYDLLTQGPLDLFVACGEPSAFGRQGYGFYIDAPDALRGALSLVQPVGSMTVTTDKQTYEVGDTVIVTVKRTFGSYPLAILSGPFAPDVIVDVSSGSTTHTFTVTNPGQNISVFGEAGPQIGAQASFNVVAAPTATSTPVPPTATPVPPTPTTGPTGPIMITSCAANGSPNNPTDVTYKYGVNCWVTTQQPAGWGYAERKIGDLVTYPPRDFAQADCKTAKSEAIRIAKDGGVPFIGGPDCGPEFNLYGIYSNDQIPAQLQALIAQKRAHPNAEVRYMGKLIILDASVPTAGRNLQEFNSTPVNPEDEQIVVLQKGWLYNVHLWGAAGFGTHRVAASDSTIVIAGVLNGGRAYLGWMQNFLPNVRK